MRGRLSTASLVVVGILGMVGVSPVRGRVHRIDGSASDGATESTD